MSKQIQYENAWHYKLKDEEVSHDFDARIPQKWVINRKWSACTRCKNNSCYRETPYLFCISESKVIVRRGYAWDGASGPTIDTKDSMKATLIHDVLYQVMREGGLKLDARK